METSPEIWPPTPVVWLTARRWPNVAVRRVGPTDPGLMMRADLGLGRRTRRGQASDPAGQVGPSRVERTRRLVVRLVGGRRGGDRIAGMQDGHIGQRISVGGVSLRRASRAPPSGRPLGENQEHTR